MPTVPSPSKSGGQGVAHLREAGAAGIATGDGAPRPEHGPEVERINAPVRYAPWPGDVGWGGRSAGSIKEVGGAGFIAAAVRVAEATVRNNNDDSSRPCIL